MKRKEEILSWSLERLKIKKDKRIAHVSKENKKKIGSLKIKQKKVKTQITKNKIKSNNFKPKKKVLTNQRNKGTREAKNNSSEERFNHILKLTFRKKIKEK